MFVYETTLLNYSLPKVGRLFSDPKSMRPIRRDILGCFKSYSFGNLLVEQMKMIWYNKDPLVLGPDSSRHQWYYAPTHLGTILTFLTHVIH